MDTHLFWNCFLILNLLSIGCFASDSEDEDEPETEKMSKEERESREMEAFLKLMLKQSQKNMKRVLENLDIGSLTGPQCNDSWHRFMAENELSPEKFATVLQDYKSGNHEKITKLVRPEQCLLNSNGKFCQLDHLTNVTTRSKSRVFDLTYALCYPRGCSNEELASILAAITETFKGTMIKVDLKIVKCITSMDDVAKIEIDTAQKMMSKLSGAGNKTIETPRYQFPSTMTDSFPPLTPPASLPPYTNPAYTNASAPRFSFALPDEIPLFSFNDMPLPVPGYPKPQPQPSPNQPNATSPSSSSTTTSTPPPPVPPPSPSPPSTSSSPISSSTQATNIPFPTFQWPSPEETAEIQPKPYHYPLDVYYQDDPSLKQQPTPTTPSSTLPNTSTTTEPTIKMDKKQLLKMIPGLILDDDERADYH